MSATAPKLVVESQAVPDLDALIAALDSPLTEDLPTHPLLSLYTVHQSASSSFTFPDLLTALPTPSLPLLLTPLHSLTASLLSLPPITDASHPSHPSSLRLLDSLLVVLTPLLSPSPSPLLLSSLDLLHSALLTLPHPSAASTQHRLALLLTSAYSLYQHLPLLPFLLPYLLLSSLSHSSPSPSSSLSALASLSHALHHFDFDDPSSSQLTSLLSRASIHPPFLRSPHGRRFLTHLLSSLPPSVTSSLHAAIRAQLPGSRPSLLTHYGHVYHAAWRASSGQSRLQMEAQLQALMHLALHASSPRTHRALLVLLHAVHSHRTQRDVEELIARLWEPLLYRALSAPHPLLRQHAMSCLLSAFPLLCLDEARTQEAHLTTQLTTLIDGLKDASLGCRVVAIKGLCGLLGQYWEVLASTAADVVKEVARMAQDVSVQARVAVCEGLQALLPCHPAHPVLRQVLPALGGLLHDRASRVQAAFVGLLLAVKRLRDIRYHSIAPLSSLLLALQHAATPALTSSLVALMANSFFPDGANAATLVARAKVMVAENATAARAFYAGVRGPEGQNERLRLVQGLVDVLRRSAEDGEKENAGKKKQKKGGKKAKVGAEEDGGGGGGWVVDAGNVQAVEDVVVIAAAVWHHLDHAALEGSTEYAAVVVAMTAAFPALLAAFAAVSTVCHSALLSMVAVVPGLGDAAGAPTLQSLVTVAESASAESVAPALHCLVVQGKAPALLLVLARAVEAPNTPGWWSMTKRDQDATLTRLESLDESATSDVPIPRSKKPKKRNDTPALPTSTAHALANGVRMHPAAAVRVLSALMGSDRTRGIVLGTGVVVQRVAADHSAEVVVAGGLRRVMEAMRTVWRRVSAGEVGDGEEESVWTADCVDVLMRLGVHVQEEGKARAESEEDAGWDVDVEQWPADFPSLLHTVTSTLHLLPPSLPSSPSYASPSQAKRLRAAPHVDLRQRLLLLAAQLSVDLLALGYPATSSTACIASCLLQWLQHLSTVGAEDAFVASAMPCMYQAFYHLTAAVVAEEAFDPTTWPSQRVEGEDGIPAYETYVDLYNHLVLATACPMPPVCLSALQAALGQFAASGDACPTLLTIAVFLAPMLPPSAPAVEAAVGLLMGGAGSLRWVGGLMGTLMGQAAGGEGEEAVMWMVEDVVRRVGKALEGRGEGVRRRGWGWVREAVRELRGVALSPEVEVRRRELQEEVEGRWIRWGGAQNGSEDSAEVALQGSEVLQSR